MGRKLTSRIKKILSFTDTASGGKTSPKRRDSVDVTEEYANAFRTESYHQFWTRVTALAMSHKKTPPCTPIESTASARLLSYRLFVQNLLDPDQEAVNRILTLNRTGSKTRILLTEYFSETANASLLCSLLLKEINHTRSRYESLKTITQSLESAQPGSEQTFSSLVNRLTELWGSINPLVPSATSATRAQVIKTSCSDLLKRLESSRDKARAKLRLLSRLKHGCGLTVVAVTASLLTIVASHAVTLLVAAGGAPSLTAAWWARGTIKKAVAQLDVATKGMFIVSRDLDTISRLVGRLNDELEHVRAMAKLWAERGEGWVRAGGEVTRQLKRSNESFGEQLDELEEHLYLCFMTINRARNLVVKQILDPGKSDCPFVQISK